MTVYTLNESNYSCDVTFKDGLKYDLYGYETAKAMYDVGICQSNGHRIYLVSGIVSPQTKKHIMIENHFDIKPKEHRP